MTTLNIGVLAIQGAVSEHVDAVKRLGAQAVELKYPHEISNPEVPLDGIILPGGESTTMSIVGEQTGIFPALREWVLEHKKPVWGTCAGMILLSDECVKSSAGQSLIGGLDVRVCRNFFGSQVYSTEIEMGGDGGDDDKYPAVFIRAPAILGCGKDVKVLATIEASPHRLAEEEVKAYLDTVTTRAEGEGESGRGPEAETKDDSGGGGKISMTVSVAVQQGHILATSFHPELSDDLRWHQYFLDMAAAAAAAAADK
jgi:5'-phosphate synthase pdxT subunit